MARYLSPEWLADMHAAAAADAGLQAVSREMSLVVQHVVTGGSSGDVSFHVVLDRGHVAVRPGDAPEPTVTFTQDRATAEAVSRGELSAQGAFMTGRIRVSGDLARLVQDHDPLVTLDDVFRSLRADTDYG